MHLPEGNISSYFKDTPSNKMTLKMELLSGKNLSIFFLLSFFKKDFLMSTIFKLSIEFVTILLPFYVLIF